MRLIGSFDSIVLAAVAADLAPLTGSRVRRVSQPALHEIVLEFRAAGAPALLCSVHPRWARLHLAPPAAGTRRGSFAQLLHSRLEGARLTSVHRLAFERILALRFQTDAAGSELVAEIMGPHSNLFFLEDGVIAGSLRPVSRSSAREIGPGLAYRPPPAGHPTPAELNEDGLRALLEASGEALAERLRSALFGLSPTMAREVAARAGLPATAPARTVTDRAPDLLRALRELADAVERQAYDPVIYRDEGMARGYAPFPLRHVSGLRVEHTTTMSAAVARVTAEVSAALALDELRATLGAAIRAAMADVDRAEGEVRRGLEEAAGGDEVRRRGELLLAYASQIAPGSTRATVPGHDGTPVTIALDPALTPVENARMLFARYAKIRRARPALEARLRALDDERDYLESSLALLEAAGSVDDLEPLREELAAEGYARPRRRRTEAVKTRRAFILAGGATVLVGRTNRENDHITFDVAAPDDLWFHARGVAGAHVILHSGGRAPRDDEIAQAAAIAAYFSRARSSGTVAVDYTTRRFVRKPKGGRPGLVTYERERTVRVTPGLP